MKKGFIFALISSVLLTASVQAKSSDESISVFYRNIKLNINSEATDLFDASGNYIEPFLYNNTTYLPLRAVAQALDMSVSWDAKTYSVGLTSGNSASETPAGEKNPLPEGAVDINVSYRDVSVKLDDKTLDLKNANGETVEPFLYNNTVYLPLRNIAEATSSDVAWDGETSTISITSISPVSTTAPYDTEATSDWTKEEASEYGYQVDFTTYADKNYAYICGYTGEHTDILIPAKIDSKVTYLLGESTSERRKVFEGNEYAQTVTFETGVKIGSYHNFFRSCKNLRAVYNLPDAKGGAAAFSGCNNLEYISNVPELLTHLNSFIPQNTKITSFDVIPATVTTLDSAFSGCINLTGDIQCLATNINSAKNTFNKTEKPITIYVPYPSLSMIHYQLPSYRRISH